MCCIFWGFIAEFLDKFETICGHCESLCESIDYSMKLTYSGLQDSSKLWNERGSKPAPEWYERNRYGNVGNSMKTKVCLCISGEIITCL